MLESVARPSELLEIDSRILFPVSEDRVWIVEQGRIDVFCTAVKDGSKGNLVFLFSIEPGQALVGDEQLKKAVGDRNLQLFARGTLNTKLRSRNKGEFFSALSENLPAEVKQAQGCWRKVNSYIEPMRKSRIDRLDTAPYKERSSWDALYREFIEFVARYYWRRRTVIAQTIRQRKDQKEALEADSLGKLTSIVNRHSPRTKKVDSRREQLFEVFKTWGKHTHVDVSPPGSKRKITNVQEYFELAAIESRLKSRAVSLGGDWFKQDLGNLVAFNHTGDALALIRAGNTYRCYDHDGNRTVIDAKSAADISDTAIMFYRVFDRRPVGFKDVIGFVFHKSISSQFFTIAAAGLAGGVVTAITPIFTALIFDSVIPEADRSLLAQIAVAMMTLAVCSSVFQFVRAVSLMRIHGRSATALQAAVVDRVLKLPVGFFRDYKAGDLADRTEGFVTLQKNLTGSVLDTLLGAVFSMLNIILMFYYMPELAAWAMLAIFIYLLVISAGYLVIYRINRQFLESRGDLRGFVYSMISAIVRLRTMGVEEQVFNRWAEKFADARKKSVEAARVASFIDVLASVYPVLVSAGIFGGIVAFRDDSFTTGTFIAFFTAFGIVQTSLSKVVMTSLGLMKVMPLYERLKPILEAVPESIDEGEDPGRLRGRIELSHVGFSYDPQGPWILDDVSFTIEPGEFVAVVGPSGSGKSTLLKVMTGFEKPGSGTVFFDEQDINTFALRKLRKQLGVVLQHGQLAPDTIANNILGVAGRSIEEAWNAARMAGIAGDIEEMPMKMFTVISEGAGAISSGQKQRMLLARALVGHPRILFLDEATSALDNKVQRQVMANLEKLEMTRVVIAHRLSTIVNADKIIVLDAGKVEQIGTYDELMSQPGIFRDIASRQIA